LFVPDDYAGATSAVCRRVEAGLQDGLARQKFSRRPPHHARQIIRNKEGRGLRMFTPFWRAGANAGDPPKLASRTEEVERVAGSGADSLPYSGFQPDPAGPEFDPDGGLCPALGAGSLLAACRRSISPDGGRSSNLARSRGRTRQP